VTKNINWETDAMKSYHCKGIQRSNYLVIESDEKVLHKISELNDANIIENELQRADPFECDKELFKYKKNCR